jgi:mutator family transposase
MARALLAYAQLRLARSCAEDRRLPWERPQLERRLTPCRTLRGFATLLVAVGTPAEAPKPCGRSPGRPTGRLSELMEEGEQDVLAFATFPQEHWQKVWSNNPLERLKKEVKRRTRAWCGHIPQRGGGDKAGGIDPLGAARRVAGRKALIQCRIVSEAGAKGGGDGAATVDGGIGRVEPRRGDLHT